MARRISGRQVRHRRVRKKVQGTTQRPRLCVFRSLRHVYGQVIDDVNGVTLAAASTLDEEIEGGTDRKQSARAVGELLAKRVIEKGIQEVVFDRGGYLYHGRVAALADGARKGGLKF